MDEEEDEKQPNQEKQEFDLNGFLVNREQVLDLGLEKLKRGLIV